MYIKMEYILENLSDLIQNVQIVAPSDLLLFKLWEPSISLDDPHALYILTPEVCEIEYPVPDAGDPPLNFMILNRDMIPDVYRPHNVLLCSLKTESIFSIVNRLGSIFRFYNSWEQKLMNLIAQNASFSQMLDAGYDVLSYPMVMMDINHNVIATTSSHMEDDRLLYCMKHGYGKAFLNIINRSTPTLEEVIDQRVVETINTISFHTLRVIHLNVPQHCSYFIGLHKDNNQPFSAAQRNLFDIFCLHLEKLIQNQLPGTSQTTDAYSQFLDLFLSSSNYPDLSGYLKEKQLPDVGTWQMMGIKFNNQMRFRTDYHLDVIEEIQNSLPHCHCTLVKSIIVVLFDRPMDYKKYMPKLQYSLLIHDAISAFRNPFFHLTDVQKVWSQILFMFQDEASFAKENVRFYKDYVTQHCLWLITRSYPRELQEHSAFQKLSAFDEKNDTDYQTTLRCYMENNCNMNSAAERLNIHRNSLLYRIHKIEEILGYNITDSEENIYMLFSSLLISQTLLHTKKPD